MADGEDPAPPERDEPHGAELWLAPFFRDSTLWPVLVTVAAVFVVLGASALLLAFVERNPFARGRGAGDALDQRRRGDPQPAPRRLAPAARQRSRRFWLLSAAAALGARWAGWF